MFIWIRQCSTPYVEWIESTSLQPYLDIHFNIILFYAPIICVPSGLILSGFLIKINFVVSFMPFTFPAYCETSQTTVAPQFHYRCDWQTTEGGNESDVRACAHTQRRDRARMEPQDIHQHYSNFTLLDFNSTPKEICVNADSQFFISHLYYSKVF